MKIAPEIKKLARLLAVVAAILLPASMRRRRTRSSFAHGFRITEATPILARLPLPA
jgi:hypothetical protein